MRYRSINATLIAFALVLTVTAFWSATTTNPDGDDAANIVAADGSKVGASEDPAANDGAKKKGNRFARFFKAPFKAVGKLFGGDDDKMRRLSEKDVARFESAPLQRVDDARTPALKEVDRSEGETARDYLERGRALLSEGRLNEA